QPDVKKSPLGKPRRGQKATWVHNNVHVTQTVEIVKSKKGALDSVLITYEIHNKDEEAHTVGIRAMVDTLIVNNDGHPFAVPGRNEPITTSADFRGKKVPDHIKALQRADLDDPGLVAIFSLKVGGKIEAPDRVSLTHWSGDAIPNYDFPVEDIGDDAAVAIYWSPRELAAGARRTVGFAYGMGIVA